MRNSDAIERVVGLVFMALIGTLFFWQLRSCMMPIMGEHDWRQSDTYAVLYWFHVHGWDFFHPEIDWAKGRSGVMGMEAPVFQTIGYLFSLVVGISPQLLRWIQVSMFICCSGFFLSSVKQQYPWMMGTSLLMFLLSIMMSPLGIYELRAIQPDPFYASLLLGSLAALIRFKSETGEAFWNTHRWYFLGLLLATFAVLSKSPAWLITPALALYLLPNPFRSKASQWVRATLLVLVPGVVFFCWQQWGKHLNTTFNGGEVYFATAFDLEKVKQNLKSFPQLHHLFVNLYGGYFFNWTLFPLGLLGIVVGLDKKTRDLGMAAVAWLMLQTVFMMSFSDRMQSHWYYGSAMYPVVGMLCMLGYQSLASRLNPNMFTRWGSGMWLGVSFLTMVLLWKSAPVEVSHAIGAGGGGMPWNTWLNFGFLAKEVQLLTSGVVVAMAVVLFVVVIVVKHRWIANAMKVLTACLMVLALSSALDALKWRSRWNELASTDHWQAKLRAQIYHMIPQEVQVVTNGGWSAYPLHVLHRKGFTDDVRVIGSNGWGYYAARGARYYIEVKRWHAPMPQHLVGGLEQIFESSEMIVYRLPGTDKGMKRHEP